MKVFADCADLEVMRSLADRVQGFTTNPTLMKAAGVSNYEHFVKQCVGLFPNHSLSFEVIADDLGTMYEQAHKLASWGSNIFVKIPVSRTNGTTTANLIDNLSQDGINVNVTAIFSYAQIKMGAEALLRSPEGYLSVFAGRIADTGRDPSYMIRRAATHSRRNIKVLWASAREVLNIKQALDAGADIITLTPELVAKRSLQDKDLEEFSLDTVKMFHDDALAAGLVI